MSPARLLCLPLAGQWVQEVLHELSLPEGPQLLGDAAHVGHPSLHAHARNTVRVTLLTQSDSMTTMCMV